MSTVTSSYRTYNARNFIEDINTDSSGNEYYIFGSATTISKTINSESSKMEFLEKTLFGKKIYQENVFFMIDNNRWISGTVYDQYDDTVDLSTKKFYAIVYPTDNLTGDYRVYKCLFNNYGAPATDPPSYLDIENEQIYRTSDGYVWKYMYVISAVEFERYRSLSYAPVIVNANTGHEPISKSSINSIFVTNVDKNKGYEQKSGVIKLVTETEIVIYSDDISEEKNLSKINGFYSGQSFYITTSGIVGALYTIDKYTYTPEGDSKITLKENIDLLNEATPIKPGFTFKIFPKIEIAGDGTGAVAIPNFSFNDVSGTITSIEILNPGSGYTNATAKVINPLYGFDALAAGAIDVEAILRPVLSPEGGHASNPVFSVTEQILLEQEVLTSEEKKIVDAALFKKAARFAEELKSKRVLVYNKITETDMFNQLSETYNLSIPSVNTYTKVGIVKNPEFIPGESNTSPDVFDNRIELSLDSPILNVNEVVTQTDTVTGQTTFSATVHEVSGNTVFLCSYHGPYKNYPDITETEEGYSDIPLNLKKPIISSQGQTLNINIDDITGEYIVTRPRYVQKTGEVYYLTSFSQITRSPSSNEEYKIVLEF